MGFLEELARLPPVQQKRVMQEPLRKRAKFLRYIFRVSAKRQVYENCTILAPDGQVLCTVDSKKLNWYLKRGLGDFVDDSKTTMRLCFEPRGRFGIALPEGRNDISSEDKAQLEQRKQFYTTFKQNMCVSCGSDQNLARYNIVPSCFRSFLPISHQPGSHDVLLLCVPCHQRATLAHGIRVKSVLASKV